MLGPAVGRLVGSTAAYAAAATRNIQLESSSVRGLTMRLDQEGSRSHRRNEPVGQLLMNQSRAYTVVARYGGDEFAIVLPSTAKPGATGYAERMMRIVRSYPFVTGPVTLSIGTATLPDDASTADDLIAAADRALYQAKREGRNRVASL